MKNFTRRLVQSVKLMFLLFFFVFFLNFTYNLCDALFPKTGISIINY